MFKSKYIIVATGPFGKPKAIHFKGMETFPGKILHSYGYKTGRILKDKKYWLWDLEIQLVKLQLIYTNRAQQPPCLVRSPVNVIPRDILGIPILQLSLLMTPFPPSVADAINAPLIRLLVGNISKLGLKKMPYGPLEQIQKDGTVPLLDIGTIKHIRQGI